MFDAVWTTQDSLEIKNSSGTLVAIDSEEAYDSVGHDFYSKFEKNLGCD